MSKNEEHKVDRAQFTEEEQLGFPPYWSPVEKGSVVCVPCQLDDGDPDFERWTMQAKETINCKRGPVDEAEEVTVGPDEFFSISNYAQLRLHQYIGHEILLTAVEKVKVKSGSMWVFKLSVSKETKAALNADRRARANGLAQASEPRAMART